MKKSKGYWILCIALIIIVMAMHLSYAEENKDSGDDNSNDNSNEVSQDSNDSDSGDYTDSVNENTNDNQDNNDDSTVDDNEQSNDSSDSSDDIQDTNDSDNTDNENIDDGTSDNKDTSEDNSDSTGDDQVNDETKKSNDEDNQSQIPDSDNENTNDQDSNDDNNAKENQDDEKDSGSGTDKKSSNTCSNCDDNNACTEDICFDGACIHENICKNMDNIDFDSMLISEKPGVNFALSTNKKSYSSREDVWATIDAPNNSRVEISYTYDGYKHYVKIPEEKKYPLKLNIPLPINTKEGIYTIIAAMYVDGTIRKTKSSFEVTGNAIGDIDFEDTVNAERIDNTGFLTTSDSGNKNVDGVNSGYNLDNGKIKVGKDVIWSKKVVADKSVSASDISQQISAGEVVSVTNINKIGTASESDEKEYFIRIKTPAPEKIEYPANHTKEYWRKKVTIKSETEGDFEYLDVESSADIIESKKEDIRLYWVVNGEKIDVTDSKSFDLEYIDSDNNRRIDKLIWTTPHLSEQEFEIEVILTPSSGTGLDINLISPRSSHFKKGEKINFKFLASYNKSLTLNCVLEVDGEKTSNITINDGSEKIISLKNNFSEGKHGWEVSCIDSKNNSEVSKIEYFYVDMTPPEITLTGNSPKISLTDFINLSFIAEDDISEKCLCNLSIMNDTILTVNASSGREISNTVYDLDNGTFRWDVICSDIAGNVGNSGSAIFYVNKESKFSIEPNKKSYNLGEQGIFVVKAPFGSEVTLLIEGPEAFSETRKYKDNFPVIEEFDTFDSAGTFTIYGFMNYEGAVKKINQTIKVYNTFSSNINVDDDTFQKKEKIEFRASSGGSIGEVTYTWDFDDDTKEVKGSKVTHSFSNYGTYTVTLTARDKKGNEAISKADIQIVDKIDIKFIVKDASTKDTIKGATISLEEDQKNTDKNGVAVFEKYKGTYEYSIKNKGYISQKNFTILKKNQTIRVNLKVDNSSNLKDSTSADLTEDKTTKSKDKKDNVGSGDSDEESEEEKTEFDIKIEDLIEKIKGSNKLSEKEKDIFYIMSLDTDKAINDLNKIKRDSFNVNINRRGFNETKVENLLRKNEEKVDQLSKEYIIDIEIKESEEFVYIPSDQEVADLTKRFLEASGVKESDDLIDLNKEIQSRITIKTTYEIVTVEYLDGSKGESTVITHDIQANENIMNNSIIISYPSSVPSPIISSSNKLLETDSLYQFFINATGGQIVYFFDEKVKLEEIKKIPVILMTDKKEAKSNNILITGLSVFSKVEIDDPVLFTEILILVVLLGVFLFYKFDIAERAIALLPKNKEIIHSKGLVDDISRCIAEGEIDNAMEVYYELMDEYKKLSKESKTIMYESTTKSYEKILIAKVTEDLDMALAMIKQGNKEEAKEKYESSKNFYNELSERGKERVSQKALEVFNQLN